MTFRIISSGTWGLCLFSMFAYGCADIEHGTEEHLAQDKAAVTAAPGRVELSDLASIKAMKAQSRQRAGLGTYGSIATVIPTGQAYKNVFALNPGQTVTAQTSNGTPSNTDTVLVLYQRSDNSMLFTLPYTNQTNIQTLQVNDDYSGLYSRVSYTNNTGTSPMYVFLMCFTYCSGSYCPVGTADLALTYPGSSRTERQVDCATGIYPADNQGGHAYVRSTIDPVLFAFNSNTPAYDGFLNDDCNDASLRNPSNSNDPCITGLTGNYTWKGLWSYGLGGSVTLYYP